MSLYRQRRKTYQPPGLGLEGYKCDTETVFQAVGFYLDLPRHELLLHTRKLHICHARHLAHYFMTINDDLTLADIGKVTGVDHATVCNSRRKIEEEIELYPDVRKSIYTIAFYINWLNQLEMEVIYSEITIKQVRYLYFLLDQLGIRHMKNDLVTDATEGRTESARELSLKEYSLLVDHLNEKLKDARGDAMPHKLEAQRADRMRKRIFSMCYSMGWTRFDTDKGKHAVDYDRLEAWLLKYGYLHKKLDKYTYMELPTLVTQVEGLMRSVLGATSERVS